MTLYEGASERRNQSLVPEGNLRTLPSAAGAAILLFERNYKVGTAPIGRITLSVAQARSLANELSIWAADAVLREMEEDLNG